MFLLFIAYKDREELSEKKALQEKPLLSGFVL
jgi:hypothetical protein